MFGMGIWTFPLHAITFWLPTYFRRMYNKSASEVGIVLGLIAVSGSAMGVIASGFAADKLRTYSPNRIRYLICIFALLIAVPWMLGLLLLNPRIDVGFLLFYVYTFFATFIYGQGPGIVAELVPTEIRATGTQYYVLQTAIWGSSVSPYVVGKLSDSYMSQGYSSANALRYGLLWSLFGFLIAFICLCLAYRAMGKRESKESIKLDSSSNGLTPVDIDKD
jgi:MFS family permease